MGDGLKGCVDEDWICELISEDGALPTTSEDAGCGRSETYSAVIGDLLTGKGDSCDNITTENIEAGNSTKGMTSTGRYDRLFTDEELDMLEHDDYDLAKDEPEEYAKEIEERLIPLDEIELRRKIETNAKDQRKATLEELSETLRIPVDMLKRNKEVSTGTFSNPEYWSDWYQKILAISDEAKRASRDFKHDFSQSGNDHRSVCSASDGNKQKKTTKTSKENISTSLELGVTEG
ncbi:hypothetical protein PHMEG_0006515 [Phytophthora megakarya]|uniref:Uncharacterized protein n=1 Tax=Phytophthora megakarya TaxID=4795 RepID=A0A225WNL7_9STRA|nr:hypothetical protein PHMEG_0006515 [Phytophthora megakarya]